MCVWCKHAKVIYRQIHALHKKEDTRFKVFFTKFFYDNHLFAFHLLSSFTLIFLLRSDVCMRRFEKFVYLRHYKNELCAMLLDVAPLNIIHKCQLRNFLCHPSPKHVMIYYEMTVLYIIPKYFLWNFKKNVNEFKWDRKFPLSFKFSRKHIG
jgi:hypothetical protein